MALRLYSGSAIFEQSSGSPSIIMKIFGTFTLLFFAQVTWGQTYIPNNLKTSSVLVIEYSYDAWDTQFLDSTRGQWVLDRSGKDVLYKVYKEALDAATRTLNKHRIKVTVVDSRSPIEKRNFNYVLDYKQKIVDNHESIVVDRRLGGFFFLDPNTNEKYAPMVENKKYIKKVIRRGL